LPKSPVVKKELLLGRWKTPELFLENSCPDELPLNETPHISHGRKGEKGQVAEEYL
jgi:hypothetical protein